MNNDIRLSTGFFHHPKSVKLQRRLGPEGIVALLQLWTWAANNRSDGGLSGMDAEDIAIAAGWSGEAEKLVDVLVSTRFLDGAEGSYCLHGWQEHQAYAAAEPARVEKARKAALARWNKQDAPSNAPSMPEHAPSNAQDMLVHDLGMPQTKPNQTKPSTREEHTHDGSRGSCVPLDLSGACALPPAPLSGEDVSERQDGARQERQKGDYEFSLLRDAYDKARQEGPMAGRQEFLSLYHSQEWPGIDELVHAVEVLVAEDDQFRRGFAPGLGKFLREGMWRMKPRAPAGEREPEMTPEEAEGKRKWEELRRKVREQTEARKRGR